MQFDSFYSLNWSKVTWFAHLHQVGFQPTAPTHGKHLWWYQCECKAICPSTTWEGAQTPHIGMTWTWDAIWKFLQAQANIVAWFAHLHQSVVVLMWVWGHMPIHYLGLKHLIYVWHGHGMQFERFYRLSQSIVAWFAHLHRVGFHPTSPTLGNHLWW